MFVTYAKRLLPLYLAVLPWTAWGQTDRPGANRPEVTDLKLQGVESVDADELLASLSITESRCVSLALKPFCLVSKSPLFYKRAYLDRDELARDIIRARVFYWQRGYRDATVDTIVQSAGRKAVKVRLVVKEGM